MNANTSGGNTVSEFADLATVVRGHASKIERRENDPADTAELIRVLARVVEGKTILKAFGAPGDWGYNTPLGAALAKAYGVRTGADRSEQKQTEGTKA